MRRWTIVALLTLAVPPVAPAAAQQALNWDSLSAAAVRALSEYLKINTTNPPGNELEGARFLQTLLARDGIDAQILDTAELGSGRANLYARLRGNGAKRAVALVNHLDVVPADPRYWSVDPFSGAIKDGYVYGRGALDMRGEGIVQLMALVALKRSGVPLTRDIVFIGNADEELGGTGAQVFIQRHPDLVKDVEFLMTEGGDNLVEDGHLRYYGVGIAEKRTFWQRLTVHGTPSHGSRPTKANPVPRLVAALDRIAHYETPLHVTPGVEKYFRDVSVRYSGQQRAWLADIRATLAEPRRRAWVLSDVYWNAILRNTISLTELQGHGGGAGGAGACGGRHGRALDHHPASQAAPREPDRHRPVSRHRARRSRARPRRARHHAHADRGDRPADLSRAGDRGIRLRPVQSGTRRPPARRARQ